MRGLRESSRVDHRFLRRRTSNHRNFRLWFVPIEISLYPDVHITDDENEEEYCHFHESEEPKLPVHKRPREQENNLNLEDQEDERDDIEAYIESNLCVPNGFFAAFVRCKFTGIGAVRTQQPCCNHSSRYKQRTENKKDEYLTEFREHQNAGVIDVERATRNRFSERKNITRVCSIVKNILVDFPSKKKRRVLSRRS